jgi:protein-tyrosine-phosphatase
MSHISTFIETLEQQKVLAFYWDFEDPAAFVASEEETLNKFREVRDQIEARVKAWVAEAN